MLHEGSVEAPPAALTSLLRCQRAILPANEVNSRKDDELPGRSTVDASCGATESERTGLIVASAPPAAPCTMPGSLRADSEANRFRSSSRGSRIWISLSNPLKSDPTSSLRTAGAGMAEAREERSSPVRAQLASWLRGLSILWTAAFL